MKIDGIEVCLPIVELIDLLSDSHYVIVEKVVRDYHFHEMCIMMRGHDFFEVEIKGVKMIDPHKFICDCHWSTVEIEG